MLFNHLVFSVVVCHSKREQTDPLVLLFTVTLLVLYTLVSLQAREIYFVTDQLQRLYCKLYVFAA